MSSYTTAGLYDAETGEDLGAATVDQRAASDAAGKEGIILVNADGDVIEPSSWEAQQPGARRVYTYPSLV